jgi:hypothetical protein
MDSLQRYEMSHRDALRPLQQPTVSFMGEHSLTQPATCNDLQQFMSWVVSAINTSLSAHAASFPASRQPISESERSPAPLPPSNSASLGTLAPMLQLLPQTRQPARPLRTCGFLIFQEDQTTGGRQLSSGTPSSSPGQKNTIRAQCAP